MKEKAIRGLIEKGSTREEAEKYFSEVVSHILRGEHDYSAGAIRYATEQAAEDILDSLLPIDAE